MSITTITAENQTAGAIVIPDLGSTVPASGSLDLTGTSTVSEIQGSADLKTLITDGDLLLNVGDGTLTLAQSINVATTFASIQDAQRIIGVVFDAYSTSTSNLGGGFTAVPLNTERFVPDSNYFSHAANSSNVTINSDGRYKVDYRVGIDSNTILLTVVRSVLRLDTGGGMAVVAGTDSFSGALDLLGTLASLSGTAILDLSDGDVLQIAVDKFVGSGSVAFLSGASSLTIQRVGD